MTGNDLNNWIMHHEIHQLNRLGFKKAKIVRYLVVEAHLMVIDDIMMFPVGEPDAVELFALINELHEKASLIITTNKSPKQWAEVLKDPVLTTALLDRILYRCEIIKLTGNSYRMDNRKTIFENTNKIPNLKT